jgi:hypothetical protein
MFNIGPCGLYYKTLRIRNVPQMEIFRSKLVSFIANHKYTSLEKHASLLRNPYIANPGPCSQHFIFFVTYESS